MKEIFVQMCIRDRVLTNLLPLSLPSTYTVSHEVTSSSVLNNTTEQGPPCTRFIFLIVGNVVYISSTAGVAGLLVVFPCVSLASKSALDKSTSLFPVWSMALLATIIEAPGATSVTPLDGKR